MPDDGHEGLDHSRIEPSTLAIFDDLRVRNTVPTQALREQPPECLEVEALEVLKLWFRIYDLLQRFWQRATDSVVLLDGIAITVVLQLPQQPLCQFPVSSSSSLASICSDSRRKFSMSRQ
jgi:hypothetical protein